MNQKTILSIISFLSIVSLVFFVLLSSFHFYLYFPQFYDYQYEKNTVYDTLGYEKTWAVTYELWDYMQGDGEFYSGFFSERDQRHMIDVRNILSFLETVYFVSCLLFLLCLLYTHTFHKESFSSTLFFVFYYSSIFCFIAGIFFLICSLFFSQSFFLFHQLVFTNDFWLLDPAYDNLVVLFPESFFLWYFVFVLCTLFVFSVMLFFLSKYIKKKYLRSVPDVTRKE